MPAFISGPWFRKGRGWYTEVQKKQKKIAGPKATESEAMAIWRRMQITPAGEAPPPDQVRLATILKDYIAAMAARRDRGELKEVTYDETYRRFRSAAEDLGHLTMAALRPFHVTEWLDRPEFAGLSRGSRRDTMCVLRRACKWAADQGKIPSNPLAGLKLPPATKHRKVDVRPEVWQKLFAAIESEEFRDFVRFLYLTGARGGEAAQLTAAHVQGQTATLDADEHKTGHVTGTMRLIELPPAARAIIERLAREHPTGPLFRNTLGRPWTKDSWRQAFARARKKAGLQGAPLTLHGTRHLFITDALHAGVPIAAAAQLVGHRSTRMIDDVYGHLDQHRAYLRQTMLSFRGEQADLPQPGGETSD